MLPRATNAPLPIGRPQVCRGETCLARRRCSRTLSTLGLTDVSRPSPSRGGLRRETQEATMDEFMCAAIEEAIQGKSEGGIPIGSVLVRDGRVIGRGHNRRVQEGNPIAHAEIDCLERAGRVGTYAGTVLYSTLMPCYLCAGAVVQFGIPRVVVGESQTFPGARA